MKKVLFIIAIGFIFGVSCGKYEDGPTLSLRSKENRLTGKWRLVEMDGWNNSVTYSWEISDEGLLKEIVEYSGNTDTYVGSWKWENKKEGLNITLGTSGYSEENYKILRLTNKELWLDYRSSKWEKI